MDVRKSTDYSSMFASLDTLLTTNLSLMKLSYEIGRLISSRAEKGAAAAAAEYLQNVYPAAVGFSPPQPAPDAGVLSGVYKYT